MSQAGSLVSMLVMPNSDGFWRDFNKDFRSNAMERGRFEDFLEFYDNRESFHRLKDTPYWMCHASDVAMLETRLFSYMVGATELFDKLGRRVVIDFPEKLAYLSSPSILECEQTDYQRFSLMGRLDWKKHKNCPGRPNRSYTQVLWEIHSHPLISRYFGVSVNFKDDFKIGRGFKLPAPKTPITPEYC